MKDSKKSKEKYKPEVSFEQDDKDFEARIQLPKEFKDKLPLVVIVHEWWGRTAYPQTRSEMLNKEGYATMVVDLYGDGQTTTDAKVAQSLAGPFYEKPEKGVELLNKYIEQAKKDPHVDASKIFVIGYCFGGTQALNLARSGADVRGVVSFHGGLTSTLKADKIKARVLAINGLSDPMVPAKDRAAFEKEMRSLGATYKVVNYKDATHAFSNPGATELGRKNNIPIAYNQAADEGSWKDLLEFLKK